jgi:nitroimidazol reductase NimA-like FMN-containing flavoprotein (pyridoxamine 5'-phosphate oxidase superfamily)
LTQIDAIVQRKGYPDFERRSSQALGVIRTLPDDRMETLLRESVIARLACAAPEFGERPYLVPLPCFYDGAGLVALSGPGTKIRVMRANPLVTIEVDRGTAPDRWESVVAEGEYEELTDPAERSAALETIATMSGESPVLGAETIVFRIRLTAKSGRYELPE